MASHDKKQVRIDETHIMDMMMGTSSDKPYLETDSEPTNNNAFAQHSVHPEKQRQTKKQTFADYEHLFIRSASIKAKAGKTIYLRPEYHRRIARILQLLEESTVSLTDYVDNVFTHHFQQFEDEIRAFCKKNNEPII